MKKHNGFTLIELLVVLTIVATLLSIVSPYFLHQTDKAKEAALKENLATLRVSIDRYYADNGHYPQKLPQLVEKRYLRQLPLDPMTNQRDTWFLVITHEEGDKGIYDVKSASKEVAIDGSRYDSW